MWGGGSCALRGGCAPILGAPPRPSRRPVQCAPRPPNSPCCGAWKWNWELGIEGRKFLLVRLLSVRGSHRLCWKTAFVACTGIHSLQAPGFMSSLPERPLTIIARRAEKIARRSNCPTTLVELGEGAAMAIAAPQQPHNAVPLQPVFCLSASRTSVVYQASSPASSG